MEITGKLVVNISGVTIQNGNVDGGGGGILSSSTLTVSDNTIRQNYSGFGGGIQNNGTLTLVDSTVTSNRGNFGGGIYSEGMLTITDSVISDNDAVHDGGGLFNDGGTVSVTSNSVISGNVAGLVNGSYGGGIYNFEGSVTVSSSTISGNEASIDGGGICNYRYFETATLDIANSTISGNTAGNEGAVSRTVPSAGLHKSQCSIARSAATRPVMAAVSTTATTAWRRSPTAPSAATPPQTMVEAFPTTAH